ncbi:MAG: hypothetical protein HOW97_21185 [Catenulispora sp.]|nr:hypothetical protein [Catenulispora sp.]
MDARGDDDDDENDFGSGDSDGTVLVQLARAELLTGARPDAVFATLAEGAQDYGDAALAVCVAAGVSPEQAQERWAEVGAELISQVEPDDAAELGFFLELAGFFDVHRQLDEREQHIRRLLDRARAASANLPGAYAYGLPSGYAYGLGRKMQTGRLGEAFVAMATFGARRQHPMPAEYWSDLLAAAELLAVSGDEQFDSCVAICRQQLDARS